VIKIMCFLKRKAGMSPAEFKAYYESTHAPLIEKMLPFYKTFTRNFFAPVRITRPGTWTISASWDSISTS